MNSKKTSGNNKIFAVSKNIGDFTKLFTNYEKSQSGKTCQEVQSVHDFEKNDCVFKTYS